MIKNVSCVTIHSNCPRQRSELVDTYRAQSKKRQTKKVIKKDFVAVTCAKLCKTWRKEENQENVWLQTYPVLRSTVTALGNAVNW